MIAVTRQRRPVKARLNLEVLEDRMLLTQMVVPGISFPGLRFTDSGFPGPGNYPVPDTNAAAGTNHIVEVINSTVACYTKTGVRLDIQALPALLGAAPGSMVFNPVVTYDEAINRFVIAAMEVNFTTRTAFLDVAYSINNACSTNLLSDFFAEHYDVTQPPPWEWQQCPSEYSSTGPYFGENPKIGWNADAIVVSMNMWTFGFAYSHVRIVSISTNPASMWSWFTVDLPGPETRNFTMAPATMHGSVPGDPMWFVEENGFASGTSLRLVSMTNVLNCGSTFTAIVVNVNPYARPGNAAQRGSPGLLMTNDSRVLNAAWRRMPDGSERLVADHNVNSPTAAAPATARWYEFDTLTLPPTPVQQGEINQGPGKFTYYPSIEINANGDLGMTFMESEATAGTSMGEYMSMYVTGQLAGSPPGVMAPPVVVHPGLAPYTSSLLSSPYRAGDYSGMSVDPVTGCFWGANEYATPAPPDNWGTGIASFCMSDDGQTVPSAPRPGRDLAEALAMRSSLAPVDRDVVHQRDDFFAAAAGAGLTSSSRLPTQTASPVVANDSALAATQVEASSGRARSKPHLADSPLGDVLVGDLAFAGATDLSMLD